MITDLKYKENFIISHDDYQFTSFKRKNFYCFKTGIILYQAILFTIRNKLQYVTLLFINSRYHDGF